MNSAALPLSLAMLHFIVLPNICETERCRQHCACVYIWLGHRGYLPLWGIKRFAVALNMQLIVQPKSVFILGDHSPSTQREKLTNPQSQPLCISCNTQTRVHISEIIFGHSAETLCQISLPLQTYVHTWVLLRALTAARA